MITWPLHVWQKVLSVEGGEAEIQEFIKAVLLHYHDLGLKQTPNACLAMMLMLQKSQKRRIA